MTLDLAKLCVDVIAACDKSLLAAGVDPHHPLAFRAAVEKTLRELAEARQFLAAGADLLCPSEPEAVRRSGWGLIEIGLRKASQSIDEYHLAAWAAAISPAPRRSAVLQQRAPRLHALIADVWAAVDALVKPTDREQLVSWLNDLGFATRFGQRDLSEDGDRVSRRCLQDFLKAITDSPLHARES